MAVETENGRKASHVCRLLSPLLCVRRQASAVRFALFGLLIALFGLLIALFGLLIARKSHALRNKNRIELGPALVVSVQGTQPPLRRV